MKIGRSQNRRIFIMKILIPGKTVFILRQGPWCYLCIDDNEFGAVSIQILYHAWVWKALDLGSGIQCFVKGFWKLPLIKEFGGFSFQNHSSFYWSFLFFFIELNHFLHSTTLTTDSSWQSLLGSCNQVDNHQCELINLRKHAHLHVRLL